MTHREYNFPLNLLPGSMRSCRAAFFLVAALATAQGARPPAPVVPTESIRSASLTFFASPPISLRTNAWTNQRSDGSFADLDYAGEPGGRFDLPVAYARLFTMAQAWADSNHASFGDAALLERIRLGLAYASATPLAKKRPGDSVHWRRAVFLEPGHLGPLLAMVRSRLDAAALKDSLALAKACASPPFQPSGTALLEHCMARLYYAAASGDGGELDRLRGETESLLRPHWDPDRGGIQADGSWLMPGPLMDLGGEGLFWAEQLHTYAILSEGSAAQVSPAAKLFLGGFLAEGASWVVHAPVAGLAFRRSLTAPERLPEFLTPTRVAPHAEGVRVFVNADALAAREGDFYGALRLSSRRTHPWEWQPGEGQGVWHGADGALWLGFAGESVPLDSFDFSRVPGTTVLRRAHNPLQVLPVRSEKPYAGFAGALSFGAGAVAGQALDSRDEQSPNTGLAAQKAWFFFSNNHIVCLGHGISCTLTNAVETVVDQRLTPADQAPFPGTGTQKLDGAGVLQSGRLTYYFPSGGKLFGSSLATNGLAQWSLWFDHGKKASNATYAYGILHDAGASLVAQATNGALFSILAHTRRVMAVRDVRSGEAAYAFFAPGEVDELSAARPCLVWSRHEGNVRTLRVSDPAQVKEDLVVRLRGLWKAIDLPPRCSLRRAPGGVLIRLAVTNGMPMTARFLENTNWPPTAADEQGRGR